CFLWLSLSRWHRYWRPGRRAAWSDKLRRKGADVGGSNELAGRGRDDWHEKKGRGMSRIERAWMLWIMAETLADDGRRWLRSSVQQRERGQGLVEYAFSIISVVAIAVAFWGLLQVA